MTESTLLKLGDVLRTADTLPSDHALYLPAKEEWDKDSPSAVLHPDDADDAEDEPTFAKIHGLKYALDVATLQDIVANAKDQQRDIDLPGLLQALRYYYENDAFIALK